jgi:hypothetical protein
MVKERTFVSDNNYGTPSIKETEKEYCFMYKNISTAPCPLIKLIVEKVSLDQA